MKQGGDHRPYVINDCGSYVTNVDDASDNVKYIRYPGLSDGNYCDYKCTPSITCIDQYWLPLFVNLNWMLIICFIFVLIKILNYYLQFRDFLIKKIKFYNFWRNTIFYHWTMILSWFTW